MRRLRNSSITVAADSGCIIEDVDACYIQVVRTPPDPNQQNDAKDKKP
jgi:hypothetical protein